MPHVPGLRSPYVKTGRLVYFGRMFDKIRLHARGALPADYLKNLGQGFDGRTCRFLGVAYPELRDRVLAGATETEAVQWAEGTTPRSDADCEAWNAFMMKRGWRDDGSAELQRRIVAQSLQQFPIETYFDLIDFDEGRDPVRTRAWELRPARAVLVMGVSGSGKSTIGHGLADLLGWRFADADDFHPPANVEKMRRGQPLDDADRQPWLEALRAWIGAQVHEGLSVVVACSALKERYRARLQAGSGSLDIIFLKGSRELLGERLMARKEHFMPASLLDSQLAALEEPDATSAIVVDVSAPPDTIIRSLAERLTARSS